MICTAIKLRRPGSARTSLLPVSQQINSESVSPWVYCERKIGGFPPSKLKCLLSSRRAEGVQALLLRRRGLQWVN